MSGDSEAIVTVHNDYAWIGDPRLGKFAVFSDGQKIGYAGVGSSLDLPMPSGEHRFQVRFRRWFRSPEVLCSLKRGDHVVLHADLDQTLSLPQRMGKMFVAPRHALTLQTEDVDIR